ncbi:MAG: insulinase family protein [Phycisphaerales bacterium]|nr:insulinase family protein [Phycisphaerales bacterium]
MSLSVDQTMQAVHSLSNGLTLVMERVPNVRSAAVCVLTPAGCMSDPADALGSSGVLADWLMRGAGDRDNRHLTEYLDSLGVQRTCAAETTFMRLSASMLSEQLPTVLPVLADIVQRPRLPDDGFAPAVDLSIQQLDAIEDEPSQKLSLLLRRQHLPEPWGRDVVGRREHLKALTADKLRADYHRRFVPQGAIISIAGNIEFSTAADWVDKAFGAWKSGAPGDSPAKCEGPQRGVLHHQQQSNQVQIGLAWDSVPENSPQSIMAKTARGILSGGMGARLFSEIREKQGLCYSVHVGYQAFKELGCFIGYAGTAPDRAQRTLDSFLVELRRLHQGVASDELQRCQIGMKSSLIMQGESSAARAGAIAFDYHHYGRPRTLDELRRQIEGVNLDGLNVWLAQTSFEPATVVTIGPQPLEVSLQR